MYTTLFYYKMADGIWNTGGGVARCQMTEIKWQNTYAQGVHKYGFENPTEVVYLKLW